MLDGPLQFLIRFNDLLTFYCLFPSLILLGGILTWKLKGLQFYGLKASCHFLTKGELVSSSEEKGISRYEAISSVLAGNLGTGNIAGIAVALTTGGPGALVWMWVAAFLGSIVQFVGSYLGCKYRVSDKDGHYIGGPIGCLAKALKQKKLALLFCGFTIVTAFFAGNIMQINCIVLSANSLITTKFEAILLGLLMIIPVWFVLVKGGNGVARFSAKIVPFVAVIYLGICSVVILKHVDRIIPMLKLIVSSTFGVTTSVAGLTGYAFSRVLSTGLNRAIMATDCGSGIVSLLQSNSRSKNYVIDGLVTLLPPIIVMIVCSITGLALLVSGAYQYSGETSASMVLWAFVQTVGPFFGSLSVFLVMLLFGYTTILAWFSCAEKCLSFVTDKIMWQRALKIVYVGVIPLGGLMSTGLSWVLADLSFIGMVTLNLYSILSLLKDVFILEHPLPELSIRRNVVID